MTPALLLLAALGPAQPPGPEAAAVRGDSPQTRTRLAEAERKLTTNPADARDDLLRILDDAGDDLVSADDGKSFAAARRYVHRFLARLPAAELKAYRDRVAEPAARLLAAGKVRLDPRPLHELLDRYAVSRPAEEAVLLLGELAFERGEFVVAERYWRRLLPDADPPYPSPQTPPALVRAKVTLAAVYRGDREQATAAVREYVAAHPNNEGRLAGRTGKLADILRTTLDAPPRVPPDTLGGGTCTTFGGNPARDGRANGVFHSHLSSEPTWVTPLPRDPLADRGRGPAVGAVRTVAFHPVVLDGKLYVADAGRVMRLEPDGSSAVVFNERSADIAALPPADTSIPVVADIELSLTAADGKLFARVGPLALFPTPARPSHLIAIDPAGTLLWRRPPPAPLAAWEGPPLVIDGRVYAVFTRNDGGRLVHAAACYDGFADRPLWVTELCDAAAAGGGDGRTRHHLLTLAGRNLVFASHSGAVVAIDARSGKNAWAHRYTRMRKPAADGRYRDACPPVYADGRVFVAPTDTDRLFAFDADTGSVLWDDGPVEVDHLLGVAGGKLVAAIAGPNRGVRGYDAASGSTDSPRGWANHDDPFLPAFGRGLVTDAFALWPTTGGLYTLRLSDGLPARQRLPGPHGNLAFADGTLFVATPTEVRAYSKPGTADPPTVVPEAIPMQPQRPALLPILQRPATLVREDAAADDAGVGFLGEHHVAAFGPSGRRWGLDGLKRPLVTDFPIASAPRFTPHAYRDPTRLVVQTTAARRLLIDATTGRVVADVPTARRPWLSPPARAGDSVVAADGPAKLTAFDPATGAIRWQADAGREPSQTGDPAQAVAVEGAILSAVARNYGVELDRLHADTGRSTWAAGPALVPAAAFDLTAADADADRVYVPLPDRLVALRADTGREVWSSPLPFAADWRAAVSRNAVVVYPGQTQPVEPADPFAAFARLPRADRGFRLLAAGFDAWLTRSIPVLLLDPTTGHLIQRLDVPARGPVVRATVRADGVAVRAGAERFVLK